MFDLQSQYNQTLQNTLGQSQQERLRNLRRENSQDLGSTDWAKRGVSGQRFAGFNEVDPTNMPSMDQDTRTFLKPLLGTYQEGGRDREGYYGATNPYTSEGALSLTKQAGYDLADSSLQKNFDQVEQKLPSVFGHKLANQYQRDLGKYVDDYNANYPKYLEQQKQQSLANSFSKLPGGEYYSMGFVPGQDNGDWIWQAGAGPKGATMELDYADNLDRRMAEEAQSHYGTDGGGGIWLQDYTNANQNSASFGGGADNPFYGPIQEKSQTQLEKEWRDEYRSWISPENSGRWTHKGGDPYGVLDYRPEGSKAAGYDFRKWEKPGFMGTYFPTVLNAIFSAVNPIAGAVMSTARSGLNGGDWGKALGQGALSYAGSQLGAKYGGDVGGALNFTGDLAKNVGAGIIGTGVGTAGGMLNGQSFGDALKGGLVSGVAGGLGNYLGGLTTSGTTDALGPMAAKMLGGGVKGLTGGALSGLFNGGGINGTDLAVKAALGAATPTLGTLFTGSNTSPDDRKLANNMAQATTSTLGNIYSNNTRKR